LAVLDAVIPPAPLAVLDAALIPLVLLAVLDAVIPRDPLAVLDAALIPPDLSAALESDVATNPGCYGNEADGTHTVIYIKKKIGSG
jgi:hypothetical protein